MKKADFGLSSFLVLVTVLAAGCGRTSQDSQMPYGTQYGQGYSPYGGSAWGTGANGAASTGDVTLTSQDMELLKAELGASNQLRLADLIRLINSNPSDLDTIAKSIPELTQILSKADDDHVYADMAELIRFLREQLGALKRNASQSERHSCGKRIGNRAGQSVKNLVGRMRMRSGGSHGGGGGSGGHH